MKQFLNGMSYNVKGLRFLLATRSLWKFTIIPFIINMLALLVLVSVTFVYFNDLFAFITKPLGTLDIVNPQGVVPHILDGLLWVLCAFLKIVFFVLSFVLIFILVFILSSVLNAPFYELMAEHILIKKKDREELPFQFGIFLKELGHSLKIELYKVVLFIGLSTVIIILSWIPFVGPLFSFAGLVFTAWFFAFGLSTYPLILHRVKFGLMLQWARSQKMRLIGFGLISLIPVLGLFLLPIQVVGGTLLYLDHKPGESDVSS